jgi:Flp pilus assembly pilin Flp
VRELCERGSNATEYTLILALIAAVIVAAVLVFGQFLTGAFSETCAEMGASVNAVNPDLDCG